MTITSSREHVVGCLTKLRVAFPATSDDPRRIHAQNDIYSKELERFHPHAVKSGCEQATREFDAFPPIKRLLPLVSSEQRRIDDRTALPAAGSASEYKLRVDAATQDALSYLADGHLREINRLEPEQRMRLHIELGKWWCERKPKFEPLQFGRETAWGQHRVSVTAYVEVRLGKSLVEILDAEIAAAESKPTVRGASYGSVPLQEALDHWRSRTQEHAEW